MFCSGMVYDDAERLYAEVRKDVEALLEEAFGALFRKSLPVSPDIPPKVSDASGFLVAFNTTFFPRRDVVKVSLLNAGLHLKSKILQSSRDGSVGYVLMDCSDGGSLVAPIGLNAICMPPMGMFTL